jgi:hypothetical protein
MESFDKPWEGKASVATGSGRVEIVSKSTDAAIECVRGFLRAYNEQIDPERGRKLAEAANAPQPLNLIAVSQSSASSSVVRCSATRE